MRRCLFTTLLILAGSAIAPGQLVEEFADPAFDGKQPQWWSVASGDGQATIRMIQLHGLATVQVDATRDIDNIWWAIVRRPVHGIDMEELMRPDRELRVEARIRTSHAPRRVNLHFNHQRTTDYHSHLMEYDIPTAGEWHTISMTTRGFAVQPGDEVAAQMALMDWGHEVYAVDIEAFRVDVVDPTVAGPDRGNPIPYHPPVADPAAFSRHVAVAHDSTIDQAHPDRNFNDWSVQEGSTTVPVLSVTSTQWVLLRWDREALGNSTATGPGLLELTVHSLQRSPQYTKDFGMVRVVEILAGDPLWEQDTITWQGFFGLNPVERILNGQMVIDYPVPPAKGDKALFTLNSAVMRRLMDGRTLGLAIRPLGAVQASFLASEAGPDTAPRLHFTTE